MKRCGSCNQFLLLDEFSKKTASKDGLMSICRTCNRIKSAIWAAQNRERRNQHQAAYHRRTYVPTAGFAALAAGPTILYRLFDNSGDLLYVGITADRKTRLRHHRESKPWWADVARIEVEEYADRESALAAETVAIRSENPRHNIRKRGPRYTDH